MCKDRIDRESCLKKKKERKERNNGDSDWRYDPPCGFQRVFSLFKLRRYVFIAWGVIIDRICKHDNIYKFDRSTLNLFVPLSNFNLTRLILFV